MALPNSHSRALALHAALFLALFFALFCGGLFGLDGVSREAAVCDAVCRQLAQNTTEGRQALVSSIWWPPLPFLLRLPFQLLLKSKSLPMASLVVSALFGASTILLMLRILSRWGVGNLRFAVAAGLVLHPTFLTSCFDGSSGTTGVYLVLLAAYGLGGWVESRTLRPLVYFAFAAAMLFVVDFSLGCWVLTAFVLFLGDLVGRRLQPGQREGAIILAVTPLAYTFGLWMLMNWLVMGDGLYFIRSLIEPGVAPDPHPSPVGLTPVHKMAAILSSTVFLLSVFSRYRRGAYLGLVAMLPLPMAYFLNSRGLLWSAVPLLFALFPLCLLACAAFASRAGRSPAIKVAALVLPLALTPWAMIASRGLVDQGDLVTPSEKFDVSSVVEQRVLARSAFSKVYVCGYEGFLLADAAPSSAFVYSLDFNFYEAIENYRGHSLYLLMHKPEGRSAMDSIHWRFPDMYQFGTRGTLYDMDLGPWRLYEIFQPLQ